MAEAVEGEEEFKLVHQKTVTLLLHQPVVLEQIANSFIQLDQSGLVSVSNLLRSDKTHMLHNRLYQLSRLGMVSLPTQDRLILSIRILLLLLIQLAADQLIHHLL